MKDLARRNPKERTQQDEASIAQIMPYYAIPAESGDDEKLSSEYLRRYWHAVRRHKGFIATLTILATLAIIVYELRQPDQYEAKARIEVDRDNAAPHVNNNSVTLDGSSDDSVYFNTQLQILTSSGLLRRVVKTLDLESNDAFLHPTQTLKHSAWRELLSMVGLNGKESKTPAATTEALPTTSFDGGTAHQDLREAKTLEPYVSALMKGLKVEPIKETRTDVRETRLIDISFSHNDPQIAAKVVNAIADGSAYMNLERKAEAGTIAADFLQKRIAELQSQIRHDEEQLLSYAGKNEIVSLNENENTVVERLSGLNRELLAAENERSQAEAAYKAALAPNAAEAMAGEAFKQTLQAKLNELRQRRAQLLVENTEEWPEVKEIDKQIAEVENQIKDQRSSVAADMRKTLETRFRQAAAREQTLRDAFNKQRSVTLTQNQAAINYRIMQQGIDTNKSILQALLQHAKETDIAQAGLSNSIHIIDYATAPEQPVGPKRLRNVGLGFLFSLGLAVGCVVVRDIFDNTFRSLADVENKLRMPALAIVPSVGGVTRQSMLSRRQPLALIGNGQSQPRPELLFGHANPILTEVFRQLRATLLLSRDGGELRTLLVTSSLPGEGKTTAAINTSISLAESGANVLLIDGDLRRPSLHKIFGVSNDRGLSNALNDRLVGSELMSLIQHPEMAEVSLLTSGPPLENPTKLFEHDNLHQLLAELESKFTYLVIDSPPIVPFADSVILGSEVDGVLMVVESGKTPRELVVRSMQLLEDVDASILGVVLNNTKPQPIDAYYHKYYHKYYESSEAKERRASQVS
jgi:capsular exopolysaccharide synthesis family protein